MTLNAIIIITFSYRKLYVKINCPAHMWNNFKIDLLFCGHVVACLYLFKNKQQHDVHEHATKECEQTWTWYNQNNFERW